MFAFVSLNSCQAPNTTKPGTARMPKKKKMKKNVQPKKKNVQPKKKKKKVQPGKKLKKKVQTERRKRNELKNGSGPHIGFSSKE